MWLLDFALFPGSVATLLLLHKIFYFLRSQSQWKDFQPAKNRSSFSNVTNRSLHNFTPNALIWVLAKSESNLSNQ